MTNTYVINSKFSATKSTHQNLKDPEEVRKLRRTEHVLLQKYTDNTQGRLVVREDVTSRESATSREGV